MLTASPKLSLLATVKGNPVTLKIVEQSSTRTVMEMYRKEVINVTKIAEVVRAYEEPPHDWGEKTA